MKNYKHYVAKLRYVKFDANTVHLYSSLGGAAIMPLYGLTSEMELMRLKSCFTKNATKNATNGLIAMTNRHSPGSALPWF